MRLDKLIRRLVQRRRLRFGTIYARVIASQPLPARICTGNDFARGKQQADC